jgi:carbonic anhydrase
MAKTHTCSTLVLHCIDFRIQTALVEYLNSRNLAGDYDRISVAGAVKDLVEPAQPGDRDYLLRQCDTSHNLHHISRVLLINHTDCGAYGGKVSFVGETHERVRHQNDLRAAANLLQERYANIQFETLIAVIRPDGSVQVEPA